MPALAAQNTKTGTKKEYILYICGMWAGNKGEQKPRDCRRA